MRLGWSNEIDLIKINFIENYEKLFCSKRTWSLLNKLKTGSILKPSYKLEIFINQYTKQLTKPSSVER